MSQQINLFNPIFLKQKLLFSATTLVQAASLVLLCVGAFAVYVHLQTEEVKKNADIITQQLTIVEAQVAAARARAGVPTKDLALEDTIAALTEKLKFRQRVVDVLDRSDFGNTKGYADFMVAFARQVPSGLWLTGFSVAHAGNDIGLQGRALKPELLPQYVAQLSREPIMQGKRFSFLQMQLPTVSSNTNEATADVKTDGKKDKIAYIEFDLHSSEAVATLPAAPETLKEKLAPGMRMP